MDSADGFSVKAIVSENDTLVQWVASGPSLERGKRWRKLFDNREAAEAYIREERRIRATLKIDSARKMDSDAAHAHDPYEVLKAQGKTVKDAVAFYLEHLEHPDAETADAPQSGNGKVPVHRFSKGSRSSPFASRRLVSMLLLIAVAFAIDRTMRSWSNVGRSNNSLSAAFESNPQLAGWTSSGQGVNWTTDEHSSGARSVLVQTGKLSSPLVAAKSMQWYRLAFQSKAPGVVANIGSKGYGYCSVLFYDDAGNQLSTDLYCSVERSDSWQPHEFRFRAASLFGSGGILLPAKMRINFEAIGAQPFYVDDVVVEAVNAPDVSHWADALYNKLPAKLQYRPKGDRWERIPLTMEKLRRGDQIRIVMLGDSIQMDLANSPLEVYLQKQYPGSRVEIIPSVKAGTGVGYFKNHVEEYVTRYKPDLVVIGGISNGTDMNDFQDIVDQIRSVNLLTKRKTEIMVVTNAWSPNAVYQDAFALSPGMRELDQKLENNEDIPDGYRGELLKFATANGVEFLDMQGIVSEFIHGPAAAAKVGPPAGANGEPYSFWMRDWVHPNDSGRQIMGRILQRFFTPSVQKPAQIARQEGQKSNTVSVEAAKPAPDYAALKRVLGEFQIGPNERPIFSETFSSDCRFALDHMILKDGFAVSEPDKQWAQVTYNFVEPLEVRDGEIAVYWSFKTDASKGQEWGKLYMYMNFTDPPQTEVPEPARVAINIRPGSECVLYRDPGWQMKNEPEIQILVPGESFLNAETVEKFRMVIRWRGGDLVDVEPAWWNRKSAQWEGFVYNDKQKTGTVAMELSIKNHLLGHTTFKSIYFQSVSDAPKLGPVLITRRLAVQAGGK